MRKNESAETNADPSMPLWERMVMKTVRGTAQVTMIPPMAAMHHLSGGASTAWFVRQARKGKEDAVPMWVIAASAGLSKEAFKKKKHSRRRGRGVSLPDPQAAEGMAVLVLLDEVIR